GPAITEFNLATLYGTDTTLSVLSQGNYYIMLFANNFSTYDKWHNKDFDDLLNRASGKHLPFFIVTSDKDKAVQLFGNNPNIIILLCDGTVIKTAARVNPTYFVMHLADIKGKYSYKNIDKVIELVNAAPP